VLLPETAGQGARKFALDIQESLARRGRDIRFEVQTYAVGGRPEPPDDAPRPPSPPRGERRSDIPVLHTTSADDLRMGAREDLVELVAGRPSRWKRGLDVLGAGLALVVLAPLLLALAAFVKLSSPGPVFFKQARVGYRGKKFHCLKFRTMKPDAATSSHQEHVLQLMRSDQPMTKLDNQADPRIIPGGQLLRVTGLDELPQLLNVLRGDMSLVGPRPSLAYETENYERWQYRRFDVVPGLTGLWQVSGKNRTTFCDMMRMDVRYTRKRTLWGDVLILLKTVPAVVGQINDHLAGKQRPRRTRAA
jgi:lipopolysaccharide/colanic/teichoic acid biosynthesis glycosyltransferase